MFLSVSLLSQAPLARGSRALPSVLFSKLTWNLPWNGASPLADQTSRIVAELERSECVELHLFTLVIFMKGRQHFITLFMFVLNFGLHVLNFALQRKNFLRSCAGLY